MTLLHSFHHETGQWVAKPVIDIHVSRYRGAVLNIRTTGGEVTVTAYHPFWVLEGHDLGARPNPRELSPQEDQGLSLRGRWVNSHDLLAGDLLFTRDGQELRVLEISQTYEEDFEVRNLTVDQNHSFSVGADAILVHNTSGCPSSFAPNRVPQGLTQSQFDNLSSSLKNVLKSEGLPDGQIFVHGSRASGAAKAGSDIDIILRVSNKDFGKLAAQRIAQTTKGNQKAILKTVRNQQRLRARGISTTLERQLWEKVFPHLPDDVSKIQFSIVTEGSSFNVGPFIPIK